MKLSGATIALYLSVVFASGGALGTFGYRYYNASTEVKKAPRHRPSPEEIHKNWVADMKTQLSLTDDQVFQYNQILESTDQRYQDVRAKMIPELQKIGQDQVEQVHAILTADQRVKYDQILKEREEKRKKGRGGPK